MSTYEPPFEYSLRSARMRDAEGQDYAKMGEQRDRELEDFLADLDGRINTQAARGIDGGRPDSTYDGGGGISGGTP